jgi:hypothetical protein
MVFDSVFLVLSNNKNIIVRVAAVDPAAGVYVTNPFYTVTASEFPNLASASTNIASMCSMDYYGLFVDTGSSFYLAAIKPDLAAAK